LTGQVRAAPSRTFRGEGSVALDCPHYVRGLPWRAASEST